jgi:DNA adenine methylase
MNAPTRPVLRWHGGKWKLAPWIISHFPKHRVYVEPFGGAASVLLRKERAHAEMYNDLDGEVVNLFHILRDATSAAELVRLLRLTPFARAEFELAFEPCDDGMERARRLVIRSYMGMGSVSNLAIAGATGFRNNTTRSESSPFSTIPAHDWAGFPCALELVIARLNGVVIESRNALDLMRQQDIADALFYCDPPYLPETRSRLGNRKGAGFIAYHHDMTTEQHVELLAALVELKAMVILSGYPAALYDDALPGWRRIEKETHADGARPRTEVLWLNPSCSSALDKDRGAGTLFAEVGE